MYSPALKAIILGRDARPSASMATLAGVVFGVCFFVYSFLLGGPFGLPHRTVSQSVIPLFNVVAIGFVFGTAAYHSARNQGILVSWLLGIALVFAYSLHAEFVHSSVTLLSGVQTLWEAAAFGVPLGTLGFLTGALIHSLHKPTQRTEFLLRYILAATVLGMLLGGLLFIGCPVVFGHACFTGHPL